MRSTARSTMLQHRYEDELVRSYGAVIALLGIGIYLLARPTSQCADGTKCVDGIKTCADGTKCAEDSTTLRVGKAFRISGANRKLARAQFLRRRRSGTILT